MSGLSDDRLRSVLRAEAATHQPDREAMLTRITSAAMTDPAPVRRGGPRFRLAIVGALVALFGGGGFAAQFALAGDSGKEDAAPPVVPTTTATPATTAATATTAAPTTPPAGSAPPKSAPSSRPPKSAPATSAPVTSSPVKGAPGNTRVEQGPLWSDGSVDGTDASVITLKTSETLTALKVTVSVAKTPGLTSRGGTKSVPGASVSVAVTDQPDALLYTFTLSSADEVGPGTYTFTAKYTHDSDTRDAGGDVYEATATTATGQRLDVYGNFYPAG